VALDPSELEHLDEAAFLAKYEEQKTVRRRARLAALPASGC